MFCRFKIKSIILIIINQIVNETKIIRGVIFSLEMVKNNFIWQVNFKEIYLKQELIIKYAEEDYKIKKKRYESYILN